MAENIDEIKDESESFSDDSLTSFGADLSFRELITMYDEGDLEKPELQRHYVWEKKEASRFIESILLGLPVPSIFLAKTSDDKRLIIDGYQRIMTVYDYVQRGVFGSEEKVFELSNSKSINERWRGKSFRQLTDVEQRKIRNTSIHAIVFEQKQPSDDSGMYQIFERINTSGRSLKPQEIRNCVHHGLYNQTLSDLNLNSTWRRRFGSREPDSRMQDIELILRIFSFISLRDRTEVNGVDINLMRYLNDCMKSNKNHEEKTREWCDNVFSHMMNFFDNHFDDNLFRNGKMKNGHFSFSRKINPAILDSVCVATYYCLEIARPDSLDVVDLNEKYKELLLQEEYQQAVSKRTTSIENIKKRINLATSILYGVTYEWN